MATKVTLLFSMGIMRDGVMALNGKIFVTGKGGKVWPMLNCEIYTNTGQGYLTDERCLGEGFDGALKGSSAYRSQHGIRRVAS